MLLQHQHNWCQPPLPITRRLSRANGGAPVPVPINVGPSIPSPSHQHPIQSICPIHPVENQPAHKIQFLLANPITIPIWSSRYNLDDTIQTIQPMQSSRCNTASVSSEGNPPTRTSLTRNTHPQLPQLMIFHPHQRPLPTDICSLPLLLNLLLPSFIQIEIAPSPRPIFWPF